MVNITELQKGDKVYYQPTHYLKDDRKEIGKVKSIAPNGGVFVVYNCAGNWNRFEDYTAANTRPEDLFLGWE